MAPSTESRNRNSRRATAKSAAILSNWRSIGAEAVKNELEFALSSADSVVLIAEDRKGVAGILWRYRVSFDKYPFLKGKIDEKASYADTLAVRKDRRGEGIATILAETYVEKIRAYGVRQAVARIHEDNAGSLKIFKRLGFAVIPEQGTRRYRVYDPMFHNNLYLAKTMRDNR